jgi:hypothetical protein
MSEQTMQVAKTILEQLGGNSFRAMTGAKNLTASGTGLSFRIGGGALKKITLVRVSLDPSDTYTVTFGKFFKGYSKTVSEFSDIYCDQLQSLFTSETGFYTHL